MSLDARLSFLESPTNRLILRALCAASNSWAIHIGNPRHASMLSMPVANEKTRRRFQPQSNKLSEGSLDETSMG